MFFALYELKFRPNQLCLITKYRNHNSELNEESTVTKKTFLSVCLVTKLLTSIDKPKFEFINVIQLGLDKGKLEKLLKNKIGL
jgi:hypothetical protein